MMGIMFFKIASLFNALSMTSRLMLLISPQVMPILIFSIFNSCNAGCEDKGKIGAVSEELPASRQAGEI